MMTPKSHGILLRTLDYCYERATGGSQGAARLASEYADSSRSLDQNIDALIRWQTAKCAAAGFATGLGGLLTLPIMLPADLVTNYYIQVKMIAAIAVMCGHDIRSDKVRTLVYVCLCGNAAADLVKDAGSQLGKKALERALARSAGRGAANFGKAVPLLGGLVGGTVDGVTCDLVGSTAKRIFLASRPA